MVTALNLLEFKEHFVNALSHMVCFLGGPLGTHELDWMILVGPTLDMIR